jgi:AP endonuclease-2
MYPAGYSGVGIYTRQSVCAPIRAEEGLLGVLCSPGSSTPYRDLPESDCIGGYPTSSQIASLDIDSAALDAEGRCLVLEFPAFVLFGVYSPANSNGLRDDFRYGFLSMLDTRIRNLTKMGKNVILTGDLNVSRDLIDTAKAEEHMRAEGMTHNEYISTPNRRIFNQLLLNGAVCGERDEGREEPVLYDLCREFHPDREGMYTHWEQKINARPGNFGSRIDFVLCSIRIKDWFNESNIQEGLMGSDHCPVYAVTNDRVTVSRDTTQEGEDHEKQKHILDLMNPCGMFKDGVRLREYSLAADVLPLSGRMLNEFNNRRNIRDMFSKKPAPPKPTSTPALPSSEPKLEGGRDGQTTQGDNKGPAAAPPPNGYSATVSPIRSPEKRRASTSTSPNKPMKRAKPGSSTSSSNTASLAKGQQSLKGFFQSRSKPADPDTAPPSTASTEVDAADFSNPSSATLPTGSQTSLPTSPTTTFSTNTSQPPDSAVYDPLALQEASKEGWTKLFSRRPPPRCESHAEPCINRTTKKPGVNRGRQFWMCSRCVCSISFPPTPHSHPRFKVPNTPSHPLLSPPKPTDQQR